MKYQPNNLPKLLITAGPTWEPIDAVRYLANRSSGLMGLKIAKSALNRAWPTTLLLGPTSLPLPYNSQLTLKRFQTTSDLQGLLNDHFPSCDILIMAAAVADFRPKTAVLDAKLKRTKNPLNLELEPTPDLIQLISSNAKPHQTVIGFALEAAENLLESAQKKLESKQLDAIVANSLETMGSNEIEATLILKDGKTLRPDKKLSKSEFADWLLDEVENMRP
ncbi:MAG: phosphopantothenoylcysteine decarboxylase [Planctomycetes bacterium]|nr:phosphopantothenoylcysteine decarboxylase [Planctomycetota bacterium]